MRAPSSSWLPALVVVAAAPLVAGASPADPPAASPGCEPGGVDGPGAGASGARRLVERYNQRDVGDPGWRRVRLELRAGDEVTDRFTVVNVWHRTTAGVRTVFALEAPRGLRGTSFLLVEPGAGGTSGRLSAHLFIPAGRGRPLVVPPAEHDSGLLGSDFTYRDLRMTIPTEGYAFRPDGDTVVAGRRARIVRAVPDPGSERPPLRLILAAEIPFLLGLDTYGPGCQGPPRRRMRVTGLTESDGVWSATRIVTRRPDGRSSELTLLDLGVRDPRLSPEPADPGGLAATGRELRDGAGPYPFRRAP